ncbi:MAG: VWA domain-containing protein [Propionibacteriaceae bacterium]|nr:VWA domain-containing protein [Propionibacteriaceae bacterium]
MMIAMQLGFLAPQRLWWLLLVPVIVVLYVVLSLRLVPGRRSRRIDRLLPMESPWKRHFSVVAAVLSLGALVVAYAQPTAYIYVPRERATVVVAIDISRSMEATDVQPTRIQAAKTAAEGFLAMIPASFNVAIVSFCGTASIVLPPSTDRAAAKQAIESLQLGPSTAIGEGIYQSLEALSMAPPDPNHPNDPAPGAIVLLSDGATNIGRSSSDAAAAAKAQGVPIYTIAYGTPNGYVMQNGHRELVPVNNAEMLNIAKISGGKKYSAQTKQDLAEVYQAIARSVGYNQETAEITERFAGIALLFAVIAGIGVISLAARWP